MATTSITPAVCVEKRRLLDELLEALHALTSLREAQTAHLVKQGLALPRIDPALTAARHRWDVALLAYMNHVQLHRC